MERTSQIPFVVLARSAFAVGLNSLPNHLHQHALRPLPIELAVEDLLPWAEIEFAIRYGDDDFPAHDLALVMRVGIVLARAIVRVPLRRRVERCKFLEPAAIV